MQKGAACRSVQNMRRRRWTPESMPYINAIFLNHSKPAVMRRSLTLAVLLTAALLAAAFALTRGGSEDISASVAISTAMSGDTAGYARATAVRAFSFPEDHGPHPGYKMEWWYVTGNLDAETSGLDEGRHVGYELTIFRIALTPPDSGQARLVPASAEAAPGAASGWRANQFYMAHFAVSDVQNEKMHSFEQFSRGAAGLAGAQASPFRVWTQDWSIRSAGADFSPLRLRAAEGGVGVDLTLRAEKPNVLQGDRGLSQKGPGAGNASYYYSYTRLATEGQVVLGGDTLAVTGQSWMDREWSTSALSAGQEGWDWFALQLDDGRDLMYYQLRDTTGAPSRFSEGVLVGSDGQAQPLRRADVELEVTERWTSAEGATYPAGWRLRIPSEDLTLTVAPYFPDQEMDTSVRYWEGAVQIRGSSGGAPVRGQGYVEMTGYAEEERGEGEKRSGPLP